MNELYEKYKGLLFSLAYQLTGSAADAEDAVQDVFMKLYQMNADSLQEPKAYFCKMITNRCLDLLKSAQRRREQYIGPWLPEPISTREEDIAEAIVRSEMLSYATLVLMERLSPAERAVFVLREALSFDYSTIAELTGKTETNCRKLMSRAKGKMGIQEDDHAVSGDLIGEDWIWRFLTALQQGNAKTVLSLLADDVVLVSDGGGKAFAAIHPIETAERVARFLLGLSRKGPAYQDGVTSVELTSLNGQTGIVIRIGNDISVFMLHLRQDKIKNLYIVRNPDKLQRV